MNGVCTHVVRLNVHSKKLDYYTGNYDAYVAERKVRDEDQQRKYDAEQRDIAEIKDFIARFGHGTVKMVRQAQSREKLLEKKLEAGLTPKPQADAAWDFTFPDPGELPTPVLMIQVRAPPSLLGLVSLRFRLSHALLLYSYAYMHDDCPPPPSRTSRSRTRAASPCTTTSTSASTSTRASRSSARTARARRRSSSS